ncbi:MAG: thiamine pyrophosphate-binding protein [Betaproteobacteria bacterium]|nr:thiamine pyrophosphate-binding protein [Betaproteobacteria bacterium]
MAAGISAVTQPHMVADAIAQTLKAWGVRWAFGIPGNDVLETVRACEEQGIAFVLGKSEPSCAFMADAVYQLTGKPAVLITALGPGISNAMSGIAGAQQERSAMVVLCGEMATRQMGIYNHQAFDHVALARPVVKYAETLNPKRAAQQLAKALDIALEHPAGPVFLNLPADANREAAGDQQVKSPARRAPVVLTAAAAAKLQAALSCATRPLALAGRGALLHSAPAAFKRFVEAWRMPFLTTYKAKGIADDRHPLCAGSVGLSPVVDAENLKLIGEADCLVLAGFDPIELRDAWLDAWPESLQVVTIDWAALNHRIFPLGEEALGDVPSILEQLLPDGRDGSRAAWPERSIAAHRSRVAQIVRPRSPAIGISPAALFAALSARATPEWIMTVDVGAHRILANHVIECRVPGQLMQSNGLGCMGYSVPAAIAAQLVHPDRPVVAMLGDGCMLMTQGELALAQERALPMVVVVLNDASLSLIKLKQSKMKHAARAVDFGVPDFAMVARGFGARGIRVECIEEFDAALAEAVASRRFTLIDALVDSSEYWDQM